MSYYDLYSYLPFLLSTTKSNNKTTKTNDLNYPTTPYQNANYLSSNSLSIHDKQYQRRTTTAARYANKLYNCTSTNYQQRSIAIQSTPSMHTQITIKTSNTTTAKYLNNNSTNNFMNNTQNYFNNPANPSANYTNYTENYFNRPLEEQLLRPEIDESSLSSKSSCTTHSSFQVRLNFILLYLSAVLCRGYFMYGVEFKAEIGRGIGCAYLKCIGCAEIYNSEGGGARRDAGDQKGKTRSRLFVRQALCF